MKAPRVLIVLPTYNERENIRPILEAIHGVLPEAHVLVIDDNSPDGTGQIADEIAERDARVQVMHRPGKLGLGTAYLAGFQYALEGGYGYVFEMDADFSHDPRALPDLLAAVQGGADLAVG